MEKIVVAIDGPAASGKSTIAMIIAKKLNFLYIDSGAMYRAITWKVIQNNINIDNKEELDNLLVNTEIRIEKNNPIKVFIDGKEITKEIRDPVIDRNISKIAKNPSIRERLVDIQRSYKEKENIVMDGRDIGTIVFPKAKYKFYLDADIKIRAYRRFKELIEKGIKVDLEEVIKEMKYRDKQDLTRKIAPLRCANDAIKIDTTNLSIPEVASLVLSYINIRK